MIYLIPLKSIKKAYCPNMIYMFCILLTLYDVHTAIHHGETFLQWLQVIVKCANKCTPINMSYICRPNDVTRLHFIMQLMQSLSVKRAITLLGHF